VFLLTRPGTIHGRMNRFVTAQVLEGLPGGPPGSFSTRVLTPLLNNLGRRLQALTPHSYQEKIQQLLYQAGPPYRQTMGRFMVMQIGLSLGLGLGGAAWGALTAPEAPLKWLMAGGAGLFAGAYLPYFKLAGRVTKRKRLLLRALPAVLDFLVIMIEAGNGFDASLAELTRRWKNTMTDEFALLLIDFQIGKARREAWHELTDRTAVPELNAFVTAILQSEQTGSSIGTLLRTQAVQMRTRRRQNAEEEARMAPVKMLIPMALFIFPCIMIVILGPAVPQILTSLGHLTGP
jgi:tight adherence protein C